MFRLLTVLAGASLLALLVAACGGGDAAGPATAPAASSGESAPAGFPVTVEGDNGPVALDARPTRIVSLSATATESLFAIGAGDQVIAVDDRSNHPAEAPATDLSGFRPNVEAVAAYEPDLVVAEYPGAFVSGLEKLGVPVLLHEPAADLDAAYGQIETLGAATGRPEEAQRLVERMQSEIERLVAEAPGPGLSVYHEIGPDYFSATSDTFIGGVYELLGLDNIADEARNAGSGYPQLSAEYILTANPKLIVLADTKCCGQTAEAIARRPGWQQLDAVREGNIVEVDDDVAARWGPRIVDFVRLIAGALADAGAR